ncbi:VirB4 family type IV secretion/conjugal transfer ATPase [Xanthomonas phaseoli]|uniref:Type IV secretion system protein virB4 n=1 Tax=Xanthomonas phaseoli pv. dieffenbachiae TaxID=92828 RepID=A0A1V9HCA8_9XANT|nr:VirB4 family type IV secretion/conjugal transfer ATPase [Xanthomonas phaseoli]MBO9789111.1 VirB4 family type IV secretion/conjugal transfer ATPase [Xanthomonas phaseoli pv. dieffenbachiae]MBO9887560.1 VirB4 family type IV secretion/conjugal transfer ATPase [Xanthomonas phaseoli pv. dieffenbachiae]MBO9912799.1 VirB4 family type IV secretion/conjugal transfer ATPase [Xanthomonas phaseoli pv. dieffenbachiae]MBO9936985.1 VirB4 family type IV secretion/conjugal transfer ATPase [Xanthomonas phaseo
MFSPDSPISEFVSISTHVAPSVLKTTGGDYLLIWHLAGLPFVGRDEFELEQRHNTFNRLLQTLRAPDFANVAFWVHDVRRRRKIGDESRFKQAFNQNLSDEYYSALSSQKIMQNELYFSMIYRPVITGRRLVEKSADPERIRSEEEQAVAKMIELATNVEAVLKDYSPYRLGMYEAKNGIVFSETLEFLGYLLNRIDEPVPVLQAPVQAYLPVSKHMFANKTGDFVIRTPDGINHFGAILNVKEYADGTYPGILNGLKYLDFEYVVTHSFSPVGRHEALKVLERTKGMMISSGDKSSSQIRDLDIAMDDVASGNFVLGEYHFTIAIYADSQEKLARQIATTRAELSNAGFVSSKEDLAVASSFYAQLPGNWRFRTRIANLSSLNFLGLSPLHNFAQGKQRNNPWGECVTTLQTTNGQPYYFNFHATHPAENSLGEKAIANTMVIGKSGTGKTALINFLLSQVQKFDPIPTIFFFDKDRGAEIFVRACGGNYLALENGVPTGFNPFQCERNEANTQFLAELIKVLGGKSEYSSREEEDIFRAVEGMLDTPMHLRSMSNFRKSLPNMGDDGLYARLRRWTAGNSLGWVFDNPLDTIDLQKASIIGFDYMDMIDNAEVRAPVINYLLHRLESLIDGRPLIYVMDEFWKILDGKGGLKEFAKNKQKTIRKQNGMGIFATQSPEDALASDIAAALIEQTATMILLPNPNASRDDYIEGLKLTDAEYQVVVSLDERSRCFLVKQGHASAVCQLNLRGMDDALSVISSSTDNIEIMHDVLSRKAGQLGVSIDQLTPEQWLEDFYANRKGSGKRKSNSGSVEDRV